MSVRSAREQAELLVRRFGTRRPPVDVAVIADRLGLRVLQQDLGPEASGLLISGPTAAYIVVHNRDCTTRRRFTIAHELAHSCLRHQFDPSEHVHVDQGYRISQRSIASSNATDPKEIEANQFAASLLMPAAMIHAEVARLGGAPLLDDDVTSLAGLFEVSEQAMTFRLQALGYL